jgi:hypothetical protein
MAASLAVAFAGSGARAGTVSMGIMNPSPPDTIIDLTTVGSSGQANSAWYVQTDPQPTGTGVIDPFVRIQNTGDESGYNTDGRPVEFNTKDENQWTHSLRLSEVPIVSYQSQMYRQFLLDINEQGGTSGQKLSLDQVEIYLADRGDINQYANLGTEGNEIYSMDTAAIGSRVEMNYKLNNGSGSGDMFLYVPTALFNRPGDLNPYVYLYSDFGVPHSADSGFEEWSVIKNPNVPTPIPTPQAVGMGLALVGGMAGRRWTARAR